MTSTVERRAVQAQSSSVFEGLARAGFVADGLVHLLLGGVAIAIAFGTEGQADPGGALVGFSTSPFGIVVLWAVAGTLFALALWHLASAAAARAKDGKTWVVRIRETGKALAFAAVGGTAVIVIFGGRADQDESSRTVSGWLLSSPGGVFVLAALGVGILIAGIVFIVLGLGCRFKVLIRRPPGVRGVLLMTLGVLGYVAKGVAIGIVGGLFLVAAFTTNPNAAGGMDAALHSLLALPFGDMLLAAVGAGLVLYGLFFIARARYARL